MGERDTWTSQKVNTDQSLYSITWSGSQFIAVGYDNTILTSSDGHSWIFRNADYALDLHGVTSLHSRFVAVWDTILSSSDSRTWATQITIAHSTLFGTTCS